MHSIARSTALHSTPARSSLTLLLLRLLPVSVLLCACNESLRQVSESGFGAFEADIEVLGDGERAVVAWYDTRNELADIYLRELDSGLRATGPEIRLTRSQATAYEPDVAVNGQHIAIAWYEKLVSGQRQVKLALLDSQLRVLHESLISTPDKDAMTPVLVSTSSGFYLAWLQSEFASVENEPFYEIVGLRLDAQGQASSQIQTLASASQTTWNINAESQGDAVTLVYDAEFATAASELYAIEVSDDASRLLQLTADDGYASKYPDLAVNDGVAALTWFDNLIGNYEIYLAILPQSELLSDSIPDQLELLAERVTYSRGDSIGAYLAWQGDRLMLSWSEPVQDIYEIFYRSWDAAGESQMGARALTRSGFNSYIPSIAPFRSGFAVAWNEVNFLAHQSDENLTRSEIKVGYLE